MAVVDDVLVLKMIVQCHEIVRRRVVDGANFVLVLPDLVVVGCWAAVAVPARLSSLRVAEAVSPCRLCLQVS